MNLIPRHVAISPGSYAWRTRTAISVILLMSALAVCTLASYSSRVKQDIWVPGGILMNEERFVGLRATLPLRGTVGYLSDPGGKRRTLRLTTSRNTFWPPSWSLQTRRTILLWQTSPPIPQWPRLRHPGGSPWKTTLRMAWRSCADGGHDDRSVQ